MTDHTREMNALQWAEHCASKSCIKTLKKQNLQSLKKSNLHKKSISKDGGEHTSPLRRIKDSLSGFNQNKNKELRGMESLVACVSAPTIPMILANANPPPNIQLLLDPTADARRHSTSRKSSNEGIMAPRIEITSDTGECITPNKNFFASPNRKQSK